MHRKSPLWLEDVDSAAATILEWTAGLALTDYERDRRLRLAVERNFEIMGEVLRRLERTDPETAERIGNYREIVDIRIMLVQGFDHVNNERVWRYIETELPALRERTANLLAEADAEFGL